MANTRRADRYVPKIKAKAPTQESIDRWEAMIYDGLVTSNGRILNAIDENTLATGRARDVSPEYWRFLDEVNHWATRYPTNDPRTWVPLVKAGLKADSIQAFEVMAADANRMYAEGGYTRPNGAKRPASSVQPAEDEESQSVLSKFWNALTGVVSDVDSGAKSALSGLPTADEDGSVYNAFKDGVQTFFTTVTVPVEAVTGGAVANLSNDIEEGDWKSLMLHIAGIAPGVEAGFIGAENLFDSDFYREGGEEQSNWSQTVGGQWLLDLAGQGRGEQFGLYDDPAGVQGSLGSGLFPGLEGVTNTPGSDESDPSTVAQWQRQARLNANTITEAVELDDEQRAEVAKISRIHGKEEALTYLYEKGYAWDEEQNNWFIPAQGATLGRLTAQVFSDPNTTAYRNISGVIDFAANIFGDPVNYVPAGAIAKALSSGRLGGKIVKGSAESTIWMNHLDDADLQDVERAIDGVANIADDGKVPTVLEGMRPTDIRTQTDDFYDDGPYGTINRMTDELPAVQPRFNDLLPPEENATVVIKRMEHPYADSDWRATWEISVRSDKPSAPYATGMSPAGEQPWDDVANIQISRITGEILYVTVDPAYRGKGLGKALVDTAVDVARADSTYPMPKFADRLRAGAPTEAQASFINAAETPSAHKRMLDELRAGKTVDDMEEQGLRLLLRSPDGEEVSRGSEIQQIIDSYGIERMENLGYYLAAERTRLLPLGTSREFGALTLDDMAGVRAAVRQGGFLGSTKALQWLNSGRGLEAVNALVDETDAYTIWSKTNYKIDDDLAAQLANATSPEEVKALIGPRIGVDITHENDLIRLTPSMPSWSVGAKVYKATDMNNLKEAWKAAIPGQEFLPAQEIDLMNSREALINLERLGRVALTDINKDIADYPEWRAAMSWLMSIPNDLRQAGAAERYQALVGEAGHAVVVDDAGRTILDHPGLLSLRDQGLADEDILARVGGVKIQEQGRDGVFTVMMNIMAKEKGLPEPLARRIMRAWAEDDELMRLHAQNGEGAAALPPWAHGNEAEPWLESDVLGRTVPLPNIHEIRKHMSHIGGLVDKMKLSDNEIASWTGEKIDLLNDLVTNATYEWKRVTLLAAGVRFPAYALRQSLDTSIAIMANGGASILNRPHDFLNLMLTSTIRRVFAQDGEKEFLRLKMFNGMAKSPLKRLLFADDLVIDAKGATWVETMEKALAGDGEFFDVYVDALNAGAKGRGSRGVDILYSRDSGNWKKIDFDSAVKVLDDGTREVIDKGAMSNFVDGMIREAHRYSRSPMMQRLASGKYTMEENVAWFKESQTAGMAVIGTYKQGQAAKYLDSDEKIAEFMNWAAENMNGMFGSDPRVLEVIASGGKVAKPDGGFTTLFDPRSGLSRDPSKEAAKLMREVALTPNRDLAKTIAVRRPPQGGSKRSWDAWNRMMFAHAGRWEDMFRDVYYREKYWEHVEDLAHMMLPSERMKMAAAMERMGSPRTAKRLRSIASVGHITRKEIDEVARLRAFQDMSDVAYDAANRREWAYALRLLSPFVQAAVNGMYRWTKAAITHPEMTYRMLRAGEFLTSEDSQFVDDMLLAAGPDGQPFIFEDPTTGQRRAAIFGTGVIGNALGGFIGPDAEGIFSMSAGSLNMAFPGLEQAAADLEAGRIDSGGFLLRSLWPGVGPVISAPMAYFSDGENQFVADFLMPYGVEPGSGTNRIMDALLPQAATRLLDSIKPSPEQEARRASVAMQYAGILAEREGGLASMTPAEQRSLWERAKRLSWAMGIVEAFANPLSPAGLRNDLLFKDVANIPDHSLYAEQIAGLYGNYLEGTNYDYQQAQAEFVNDLGLDMLLLTTPSGDNSDAAPPTAGAKALHDTYGEGYDKYGPVLKYLLTDRDGSEFDIKVWSWQNQSGQRDRYDPDKRFEIAQQTIFGYMANHRLWQIQNSALTDLEKVWASNDVKDELELQGWTGFILGRTVQERNQQARLMYQASRDGRMTEFIGKRASRHLQDYLSQRSAGIESMQYRGMEGNLATSTTAPERWKLFALGEAYAASDERFAMIWWKGLRSEVAPDEED